MGQGNLFSDAVKQVNAQLIFELLDLDGDRGLRVAKLLCGLGKTLVLCHLEKGTDFTKFHKNPFFHH